MKISDMDRLIALIELAAMEPTTVGDTPVVILDVPGDALREALAVLRSMRDSAIEGWVPNWESDAPEGKYIEFHRDSTPDPSHPSVAPPTRWTAALLIPGDAP